MKISQHKKGILVIVPIREAFKEKNYRVKEIVPIPSDTPTIETVSEYLDSEHLSWRHPSISG